jgi:hypothetical protein
VLLVAAEGGQGIMGIPEVLSHLLSYSRLIGILLSAVILATIVNIGYWGFVTRPAASIGAHAAFVFIGILILIMGQVFVLILAVFEPGIQGARLIFVEHFSKFYEGNGRPFMPFRSPRTYTRPRLPLGRRTIAIVAGSTGVGIGPPPHSKTASGLLPPNVSSGRVPPRSPPHPGGTRVLPAIPPDPARHVGDSVPLPARECVFVLPRALGDRLRPGRPAARACGAHLSYW